MIVIQHADFSTDDTVRRMLAGNAAIGGIVTFIGTVRDYAEDQRVTAIELEHYPGMTERELERIEAAARARFDIEEIVVVHRVGRLAVSENIVLVVAGARHRAAAFEACRFMIDHLKVFATLWKKEITESGEAWVDSCPGCQAEASRWDDMSGVAHTHAHGHGQPPAHAHGHGHGHGHGHAHHHNHSHATDGSTWSGLGVGVLTLSDSRGRDRDKSGDALEGAVLAAGGKVLRREILPDEAGRISAMLTAWADEHGLDVILTTGGTGPAPRDVTPEATRAVCDRELPGIAELIRREGLKETPTAVLTRGVTALRGRTLVVNLPGSSRGAAHGFGVVKSLVPHILAMVRGEGHPEPAETRS